MVPPADPQALATASGGLLANAGLRRAMGQTSRVLVEERFAEKQMVDAVVDLLAAGSRQG